MIGLVRLSGPLLVSLTAGALLIGVVALAQPAAVHPTGVVSTTEPTSAWAASPALHASARNAARNAAPVSLLIPAARSAPSARAAGPAARSSAGPGPTAQVVALVNRARGRAGCDALSVDPRLTAAAQGHSADMAANDYFEHDGPDGSTFADRIQDQGYPSPGGENIAWGQQSAQEVVTDWLNSPSHRANIEDCSYTTTGVGLAGTARYWTQDFGR